MDKSTKSASLQDTIDKVMQSFYQSFPMPNPEPLMYVDEVLDDNTCIVCQGEDTWKVGYSIDANGVTFDEQSKWQKVEETYVPVKSDFVSFAGSEVKAIGEGKVSGYLVRFGDENNTDITSLKDFFQSDTNFGRAEVTDVLYHHGLDEKIGGRVIGEGSMKMDDLGIWIEAQLDMADEYEKAIYELVKKGKLGWSSGTASHRVTRKKVGNANKIMTWPLGLDASLTPMPAEPRNHAISLKSITVKDIWSEAGAIEDGKATNSKTSQNQSTVQKGGNMDETKETKTEIGITAGDILESIQQVVESATEKANMKAQTEVQREEFKTKIVASLGGLIETAMKAAPAEKKDKGAPVYIPGGRKKDDYNTTYMRYLQTGDQGAYKALVIMNETDDESGGAVVPTDFYSKIIELRDPASIVRKMGAEFIPTSRLTINLATEASRLTAPADTAESAGASAVSRTINEVEPLDTVSVTVDNYTYLLRISEEDLNDQAANLESFISNRIAKNFAIKENSALKTAIYADVSNTLNAADDTTLAAADVFNTYYDLPEQYADGAVWLMKRSTEGALRQLTGSPFAFGATPQGTSDAAGQRTLLYNPVFNLADMDAIAAAKKVIYFGDPYFVKLVQNGTMSIRRLNERFADTGEVGFVCSQRFAIKVIGGGETWTYLLTLAS